MPPANGFQRVLVAGIPVWKNAAGDLYAYETNGAVGPQIGTLADGFATDCAARLQSSLQAYRDGLRARPRASGSAAGGKKS